LMKFTFNWLKEFVTLKVAPEKLAELLTMAGIEVESLTSLREPGTSQEDWLFEIAVTPNRGDCFGIAGVAREGAAMTGGPLKPAKEIRKFTTLDGVERELLAEDLLICDGDVPVALAGVMGGMESEVRESTCSVLLESANFDPMAIRRTAKRLALHSEASHRFERGVDPEGTVAALNRAVYLLSELTGVRPVKGLTDRYPRRLKMPTILL